MPYSPRATYENAYGPQVSFRTEDVLPPSAYYLDLNDQLALNVITDVAGSSFTLVVRILRPEGTITVDQLTLNQATAGGSYLSGNLTGVEGYVLSACVSTSLIGVGRAWTVVSLVRAPFLATSLVSAILISGYVGQNKFLSYPTMLPSGPLEGPGGIITQQLSPAPGAEWRFNVPPEVRWQIRSGIFYLATSAAAGNRQVTVQFQNNIGTPLGLVLAPAAQAAALTQTYSLSPGGAALAMGTYQQMAAPSPWILDGGSNVQSVTAGLQTGDQYSAAILQVEEWVGAQ